MIRNVPTLMKEKNVPNNNIGWSVITSWNPAQTPGWELHTWSFDQNQIFMRLDQNIRYQNHIFIRRNIRLWWPSPRYCEGRGQKHKLRLGQSALKDLSRPLPFCSDFWDTWCCQRLHWGWSYLNDDKGWWCENYYSNTCWEWNSHRTCGSIPCTLIGIN